MHPELSVQNLSKTYGDGFQALKDVTLEIQKGEIFALLGPNGAGKTTLISIICGLVNPSHGDAALASLHPDLELAGVVTSDHDRYRVRTNELDTYLLPRRGHPPTIEELHRKGRGIAYTRAPFAYLFQRRA